MDETLAADGPSGGGPFSESIQRIATRAVRGAFEAGWFGRRCDDGRHVRGTAGRAVAEKPQDCLVSQKIFEISSILPSSWSPTAGSIEPLTPEAPASLVASLNSWLRFGYFSKCGALK